MSDQLRHSGPDRVRGFRGCVSDWLCNWLLGISHVSSPMGIVGDFPLIIPYGVRGKGFLCGVSGLRVA